MTIQSVKTTAALRNVAVIFLFSVTFFAQGPATELTLNDQLSAETKGGETKAYVVSLPADHTARIEVVQDGIDVNFQAYDLNGQPSIIGLSPSGLYGNDLILVTAKQAGTYRVEVMTADPRAKPGRYAIVLKEIRPTVDEDFRINEATSKILQLAQEATRIKYDGTIKGLEDAIAKWDEAIIISRIKKDKVWEGVAIVAKGLIYEQLGEVQAGRDAFLQSLQLWRELGNRQYEGSALNNLGFSYMNLGEPEKSVLYFEQAIATHRETKDRPSEGSSLNNLAYAYMKLGEYERSEDFFRQALVIKKDDQSLRDKRILSNTLNNLGTVLMLRGKSAEGMEFLQRSLDLRGQTEYPWGVANSLLNLGKYQWESSEKEAGFEKLTKANEMSLQLGDRRMQSESYYQLAKAENEKGNVGKAIENVSKGLEIIKEIRSRLAGSESRYAYFSTVQNFYDLYIDLLVTRFDKEGDKLDVELAFELSERSRSRSLIEVLQEARVKFTNEIDPALLAEQRNLQKLINDRYASRQALLGGKPTPAQVTKVNGEISELNTQIQGVKLKIRRNNPKLADLSEGKTTSFASIQQSLGDDTVLLEYRLGETRSFLWCVTRSSIALIKLPSRSIIEAKAKQFYDGIVANRAIDKTLNLQLSRELSDILLGEVSGEIEGKRLAIVAHGILQYAPFSALSSPNSVNKELLLVETNEIVFLPSASVLAELRENQPEQNKKTIAIFADPVFDLDDSRIGRNPSNRPEDTNVALNSLLRDFRFGESLPRLLASRQEAKNISNLVEKPMVEVLMDFQASRQNIETAQLRDFKILHFATHGLLNSTRPELSGLVFSMYNKDGQKQDGFLSLNDVYNLDLSSDLVVLSACQTALGKDVRGEGIIGLSRGFLYAGADRIIASLWKVDDSATAEFMKRFYTNYLQKEMSESKALQQTKNEMKKIKRFQSPYYWSAFTLLGDWK